MSSLSIILPLYGQANFLATSLYGLVRHSWTNPKILVVYSRPEIFGEAPTRDFMVRKDLVCYAKYTSVQHYIDKKGDWCQENNIEFWDVTEQCQKAMAEHTGPTPWGGGPDVAFKDNLGLMKVETEFICNNWDADFFPGPGWDQYLIDTIRNYPYGRAMGMPVHVQPYPAKTYNLYEPIDDIFVATRYIANNRPILVLPDNRTDTQTFELEWLDFIEKNGRDEVVIERCGLRDKLHWVPTITRTDDAISIIGPWSLMGSGYDIEMDDHCGRLGFVKLCPRRSFIMHKGFIVDENNTF